MPLQLLIVDDNRESADTLAFLLRRHNFTVDVAYDGKQAIEAAVSCRPDVFIVDLVMPHLDGFELAKRLRAMPEFAHSVFVALSGLSEQSHLDAASKAQFDEYLFKPPKIDLLLGILSEASDRAGK
ncbi:MAG TPA: response regulator [Pirellulales bacterium]|nr:response regulator [Pirellulales bacterium]